MRYFTLTILCLVGLSLHSTSQCNTSYNLALGKKAYASSLENSSYPASNAFDGNTTGTRWSSQFSDPQYIFVDLGAQYSLCQVQLIWESAYATAFNIDVSNDSITWTTVSSVTGNTSQVNTLSISATARYVRMYGISRATPYGYSLFEFQVYGNVSSPCTGTNYALNQPAYASSLEAAGYPASYAVDGSMSTRWSSGFSDPQYLYVDLGAQYTICQVAIYWENAMGASYNVDISSDASTWTTMDSVYENDTVVNSLKVSGTGRYVRMYGLTRTTGYGYSIYEFQVYGNIVLPVEFTSFNAKLQSDKSVLLSWSATLEAGFSKFEVQRSSDGVSYSTLSTLTSDSSTGSNVSLQYVDASPLNGTNYYRIKEIDLNGAATYSTTATVYLDAASSLSLKVYPNPTTDILTIENDGSSQLKQIELYNTQGARVAAYANPQNSTVNIPLSSLPAGIYFARVTTDATSRTFKISVQSH